MFKIEDNLRIKVKIAKALNNSWNYKQMAEVIHITPHAFYNWLHGDYELSNKKENELENLICNLLDK